MADSIPIRIVKALQENQSLRRLDVRLAGFDAGLQSVLDDRLEERLDADADAVEEEARRRRLEKVVRPKVDAKMKKIFPHHFDDVDGKDKDVDEEEEEEEEAERRKMTTATAATVAVVVTDESAAA